MSKSIKLIKKNCDSNKLEIDENALNIIKELEGQIAIIMITGAYRSGKSYLISELAKLFINNYDSNLFSIGHTDMPCTEGIWILNEIPKIVKDKQDVNLIFMDTEGLESIDNEMWDTKLFLISLLISTTFIYNSRNTLSQDVLNKLSIITDITNKIKPKSDQEISVEKFKEENPDFIWIIRDFSLIQTKTADEVLEKFLKVDELEQIENERKRIDVENRNEIRQNIKNFFNKQKCFYFSRPYHGNPTLLDKLDSSQIEPIFIERLRELGEYLKANLKPKSVNNRFLNGYLFSEYLKAIIETVNESKTFFMHDAILKLEADYKLNLKREQYDHKMIEYLCEKRSWTAFKLFENHLYDTLRNEINVDVNKIHIEECQINLICYRDERRTVYEKNNAALIKDFNLNQAQTLYNQSICITDFNDISEFDSELINIKLRFKQVAFELNDQEFDLFWDSFLIEKIDTKNIKNLIEVKIKEKQINELNEKNRRLNEELQAQENERKKIEDNSVYVGNLRIGGWVGKQLKRF